MKICVAASTQEKQKYTVLSGRKKVKEKVVERERG